MKTTVNVRLPSWLRELRSAIDRIRTRLRTVEADRNGVSAQREDLITGIADEEIPGATFDEDTNCVTPGSGLMNSMRLDSSAGVEFCPLHENRCKRRVYNWDCCPIPKGARISAHRVFNSPSHFRIIEVEKCEPVVLVARADVVDGTQDENGGPTSPPGYTYDIYIADGSDEPIIEGFSPSDSPCTSHLRRYVGAREPAVCVFVCRVCDDGEATYTVCQMHEERIAALCDGDDDDTDPEPTTGCFIGGVHDPSITAESECLTFNGNWVE